MAIFGGVGCPALRILQCSIYVPTIIMNYILRDFLHKFNIAVYLDDVCVYTHILDEHLKHLRLVLQRFREEGMKLHLKKCFFGF
jgi:hypothetical protein